MHKEPTESRSHSGLRGLYRWFRYLPERALHGVRHRRAVRRLRQEAIPSTVVMICHGNICRSPYAALALGRELPAGLRFSIPVTSAGLSQPGRPCPQEARVAAGHRRVDLQAHVSKLVSEEMLAGNALIVVMEPGQSRMVRSRFSGLARNVLILGDLDPEPVSRRQIQDPVEQPLAVFEATYDRIDRCVATMVSALQSANGTGVKP